MDLAAPPQTVIRNPEKRKVGGFKGLTGDLIMRPESEPCRYSEGHSLQLRRRSGQVAAPGTACLWR